MERFDEYGTKYPELVWDIWQFFLDKSIKSTFAKTLERSGWNPDFAPKCALDFSIHFKDKYSDGKALFSTKMVAMISNILCENNIMTKVFIGGLNGDEENTSFYQAFQKISKGKHIDKELLSRQLNNLVYGFPYIYKTNKEYVRPIWVKQNNKLNNGTCFNSVHGIITAKHCIINCEELKIEGINADALKSATILGAEDIDLILIKLQDNYHWKDKFHISTGAVLDDIMVMGYPNLCGFERFLTATTGAIAAIERSFLRKYEIMLLTGKLQGGNSGGPVLNNEGDVVGIVTEIMEPQGDYDKFGYGLAIPSYYLNQLEEIKNNYNFVDEITPIEE